MKKINPTAKRKPTNMPKQLTELTLCVNEMIDAGALEVAALMTRMAISKTYLRSLRNGHRPWSGLSDDAIRALATLMNYPPIVVMVMAGKVRRGDFFSVPSAPSSAGYYDDMAADPNLRVCVPSRDDWQALPTDVQQAFLLMFNAAKRAQRATASQV